LSLVIISALATLNQRYNEAGSTQSNANSHISHRAHRQLRLSIHILTTSGKYRNHNLVVSPSHSRHSGTLLTFQRLHLPMAPSMPALLPQLVLHNRASSLTQQHKHILSHLRLEKLLPRQ